MVGCVSMVTLRSVLIFSKNKTYIFLTGCCIIQNVTRRGISSMANLDKLRQLQSLPLEAKVWRSRKRIEEWAERFDDNVYVSFSGGLDSTVLLHMVREVIPDTPGLFFNTGLEYPESVKFVRRTENVTWMRPKRTFKEIVTKWGYPVISKEVSSKVAALRSIKVSERYRSKLLGESGHRSSALAKKWRWLVYWADFPISDYCCEVMKKQPAMRYEHKTGRCSFLGTMADESQLRKFVFMNKGCNQYEAKRPSSQPMLFWTKKDVWEYIHKYNVPYSDIYDKGVERTGCMFCMFGIHKEKSPNRFERLAELHPKIYQFGLDYLGLRKVLKILDVPF